MNKKQGSSDVGHTFGAALAWLKNGRKVAREGWNGKGMYLWLLPAAVVKAEWCKEPHLRAIAEANGGRVECLGSIRMMTADKKVLTGWMASQTDMLAEDWILMDEEPARKVCACCGWEEPVHEVVGLALCGECVQKIDQRIFQINTPTSPTKECRST